MDMINLCRCCLRCPPDKSLTAPYIHFGKTVVYFDMLKDCFDLHLTMLGGDSCGICFTCVGRLQDASDFKRQVQHSQEELQRWLWGANHDREKEHAAEQVIEPGDRNSGEPELCEELPVKAEMLDTEDTANEICSETLDLEESDGNESKSWRRDKKFLRFVQAIQSEELDATSNKDSTPFISERGVDGANDQPSMTCSVVLERLPSDGIPLPCQRPYNFKDCAKTYRNKSNLRKHVLDTHSTTKSLSDVIKEFACGFCDSKFQTKLLVLEHEKMKHSVTNVMMCSECDYTTISKESLVAHITSHTVRNRSNCSQKLLKCDFCDYKSNRKGRLQSHLKTHTKKLYICSYCGLKCENFRQFKTHTIIHTGQKLYKCKQCNFKSNYKKSIRYHATVHTDAKPFTCTFCDYKTSRKIYLRTHLKTHTGETSHKCNYCNFKANRVHDFKEHLRLHTGERLECNLCGYKSCQKSNLRRHLLTHSVEMPFKCSKCNYKSRNKQCFKYHQILHDNPFKCSRCDYKCVKKTQLQNHEMIHTGFKPFECSHCGSRFRQKKNLAQHEKIHNKTKP